MPRQRVIDNRFKIGKLIGSGGMGEVFQGQDLQTNQLVAIKSLRDEVVAQAPSIVERFEREGEALRLLNHPNIVKVIAALKSGPKHYLVMEYVGGGSLAELLAREPQLPLERVREIALDLADALARAHRLKIIHRDIKPANVLLADDGTPRLTDFGIAHIGNLSSLTQTGMTVGTYPYLSPEACDGKEPDERTDIWAFGVLLFEMITGRRPFEGRDVAVLKAILHDPVPDIALLRPDVSPALAKLTYRMLHKEREKRISSARQVGAELDQIGFGGASIDSLDQPPDIAPAPSGVSTVVHSSPILPAAEADDSRTTFDSPPASEPGSAPPTIGGTWIKPTAAGGLFRPAEPATAHSLDFDMIVEAAADSFAVRVQAQDSHGDLDLKTQSFVLPFDLKDLPRQRKNTADWVKLARIPRRAGNEELRYAREFGDRLFRQLFAGEVLAAFRTCQADLKPGQFLRIRLRVPEELVSLPWELLYDAKEDQFLALATDLSLVRYPRVSRSIKPLRVDGPLRVLAVLASPDDPNYQPIKLERELRGIEAALNLSRGRGEIVLEVIRGPNTLLQLRERLRQPVHILHILSHGDLDEENGEGVLIFEDADGAPEPVNARLLRLHLEKQHGSTVLVLLNACLGALPVANDPFSSIGAALLQGGVPAVIAMQFELADDAAAELARIFYAELAAGTPVDLALREARLHLYGRYRTRLDWAVPVLFLRAEGGQLIDRPERAANSPSERQKQSWLDKTRAEIAAAEQRYEWDAAVALLEQYCQQAPEDTVFKERLEHARAEQALDRMAHSAAELAQAKEWPSAIDLLQQIAAKRPDYSHPRLDLAAIRRQADQGVAYQQAAKLAGQAQWNSIIELLQGFQAGESAEIDQLLAQARREQRAQQTHAQLEGLRSSLLRADGRSKNSAFAQLETLLKQPQPDPGAIELLAQLIELPHMPLDQRLSAAALAAALGDKRLGVATLPPALAPLSGAAQIARYPITNAQFRCFVEDHGYDPDRPWWQADGKEWLLSVAVAEPEYWRDEQFGARRSNHPVVGVSWFEAEAFCLWLTQSTRYNPERALYRLPLESEWQQAAQGAKARVYPWGNDAPAREHANFNNEFGGTTPVGCFLLGATPAAQIFDMAGNVWEWTSSTFDAAERSYVVRGGSWANPGTLLRAQHRHYYSPDYDSTSLGFRVIRLAAGG